MTTTSFECIQNDLLCDVNGGLKPINWGEAGKAALHGAEKGAVKGAVKGVVTGAITGGPVGALAGGATGAVKGAATGGIIAGGKNILHQEFGWF